MERKWDIIDTNSISRYKTSEILKNNYLKLTTENPNIKSREVSKILKVSEGYISSLKKLNKIN